MTADSSETASYDEVLYITRYRLMRMDSLFVHATLRLVYDRGDWPAQSCIASAGDLGMGRAACIPDCARRLRVRSTM